MQLIYRTQFFGYCYKTQGVDVRMKEKVWDICGLVSTRAGPSGGFYHVPNVLSSTVLGSANGFYFFVNWHHPCQIYLISSVAGSNCAI